MTATLRRATIAIVLALPAGVQLSCEPPPAPQVPMVEWNVVVDVAAPRAWLDSHQVKLRWSDQTLDVPGVFRIRAALSAEGTGFYEARVRHGQDVLLRIADREVGFAVEPEEPLTKLLIARDIVLGEEGGATLIFHVVVGPAVATAEDLAEPTVDDLKKLIASEQRVDVVLAPTTQPDAPQ